MEFHYNCDLGEGNNFVILMMILGRKN